MSERSAYGIRAKTEYGGARGGGAGVAVRSVRTSRGLDAAHVEVWSDRVVYGWRIAYVAGAVRAGRRCACRSTSVGFRQGVRQNWIRQNRMQEIGRASCRERV